MTRWLGWTIVALLIISILLSSVVAGLVATESGSRWLVAEALSFAEAPVEVERVDGRLLTTLRIGVVRYASPTINVAAHDVSIRPTWLAMLWNDRVTIARLTVGRLDIATTPGEPRERPPTLPSLPVVVDVSTIELRSLRVNDLDAEWLPSLIAAVRWDERALTIERLRATAPRYTVEGEGTAAVGGALTIDAALRGTLLAADTTYEGSVVLAGRVDALRIEGSIDAPWKVAFKGAVEPLRPEPLLALDLDGRDLEWQGYRAQSLEAHVAGTRSAYAGQMHARVSTPYSIEGEVNTAFTGRMDSIQLEGADVRTNVGTANGNANVVWSPAVAVEFSGTVQNVNPQLWIPGLQGNVAAQLAGTFADGVLALAFDDVSGELAARPITGHGEVRVHDGAIELESVELASGADRAAGSGRWRDGDIAVTATFVVKELAAFVSDAAGDLAGSVDATRTGGAWSGRANVASQELRYRGARMTDVVVDVARSAQGRSSVRGRAATATSGEITLADLLLEASGPDARLVVNATAHAPDGESSVNATLRIADGSVRADVVQGAVVALPGGAWRLDAATRVDVASDHVRISPHCWRASDASLCIEGLVWQGDRIDSKGRLDGLPVATIAWLDPALEPIRGTVNGDWRIERRGDEWRGAAELATEGLRYDPEEEKGDEVALPPVRATLALRASGASLVLTIGDKASQMATAQVRTRGYDADARIEGRVDVEIADLTTLATLSERASNTKGRITGELSVGGSLRAPLLTGHIRLEAGGLEWQEPYLNLDRVRLDLALAGDGVVTIDGSARSRDSNLHVNGTIREVWSSTRRLVLSLTSDPAAVAMPDMEVTLVPALDLDWTLDATTLTGVVRVPTARIKVSRLPEGATARSNDVVVMGREDDAVSTTNLEADLNIALGDDVRLSAFGLDTRLTGSLRLRQEKRGPPQLFGRIDLVGGNYSAYGRSLAIESGRLLFQGPPDDPDVDVRAVRKIERPAPEQKVTVGVHVRGHATGLESTLFSDPAMAESDALSYLVMGRPLKQTTANEGQDLSGIAMALGLAQATGIVNQIRTRIGLDELGAGTSAAQETTVVAGKQVATKLYARYTYNTFTRLSALLLRYDLTRKLSLEATAGEAPGMDVIYRVGSE